MSCVFLILFKIFKVQISYLLIALDTLEGNEHNNIIVFREVNYEKNNFKANYL